MKQVGESSLVGECIVIEMEGPRFKPTKRSTGLKEPNLLRGYLWIENW